MCFASHMYMGHPFHWFIWILTNLYLVTSVYKDPREISKSSGGKI